MQFERIPVACLQKLAGGLRTQEQTLEVRLPDGMPDIGRVLGAWGQVIVRGKEWNADHMAVSCGVMAWVLYVPEDETGVRSVEAWLPFSMKWELPEARHDGKIMASCLLRCVDARSTSARKMIVRADLTAMGEAWLDSQAHTAVPEALPEDIALLKATYPMLLPKEAGEKAFLLEEQFSMPSNSPRPEKLMYYSLQPEITDKKVMAGKVVFRGNGALHMLYRAEDGRLYSWDCDVPFSQYADLDGEYGEDAVVSVYPCVTSMDVSLDENGNLLVKAGILGQYFLSDRTMVTVAEDAYSPCRPVALSQEQLQLPSILDRIAQNIHAEQTVQVDAQQIIDVAFYPECGQVSQNDAGVKIDLPGQFQMLYYDTNGELCGASAACRADWGIAAADDCGISTTLSAVGRPQAIAGAGSVNLRGDLSLEVTVISNRGIDMVSGIEIADAEAPDPNRPALLLCRKGSNRLWDLAKMNGSTVARIMEANQLTDEPDDDRILLIPVC